jgi:hypothetical protein
MFLRKRKHKIALGKTGRLGLSRLRIHESERHTHTYVVGITGKGKSKLLEHILFQDIIHGRGCGVLDPHSDLVEDLLQYLHSHPDKAQSHWDRIIYFDPSRRDYLVPFNVLNTPYSPYETAQNIVEAFQRTWPKALAEAPRFANIVTASVLTLIANELTLIEIPRLLTDRLFRNRLLLQVDDPELIAFWRERYEKWGRETPVMIESVLNKVTAFTFNPQLRLILGASENRLDFRQIMDEGKVLLIDLGRCDGETRRLLGSLIVTGLEQAARSRKNGEGNRRPFYFCIDEFQDFCANDGAAQTLAQILSECRKFGLHLTLAHQTLAQINERMKGALGNIQLKIVFGVSRQDAEILARHLFQVDGERIKHIVPDTGQQERSHPIFYTLQEEWEKSVQVLQNLPPRISYVAKPRRAQVNRMETILITYKRRDHPELDRERNRLAEKSGLSVEGIEAGICQRGESKNIERRIEKPILRVITNQSSQTEKNEATIRP